MEESFFDISISIVEKYTDLKRDRNELGDELSLQ